MGRAIDAVAGLGVVFAAWWVLSVVWPFVRWFGPFAPDYAGGGIGAVSSGLSTETMMLLGVVLANRLLVRWSRWRGGVPRALHRAHSVGLVALFFLIAAVVLTLTLNMWSASNGMTAAVVLGIGSLFVALVALTAVLLMQFVLTRVRRSATSP